MCTHDHLPSCDHPVTESLTVDRFRRKLAIPKPKVEWFVVNVKPKLKSSRTACCFTLISVITFDPLGSGRRGGEPPGRICFAKSTQQNVPSDLTTPPTPCSQVPPVVAVPDPVRVSGGVRAFWGLLSPGPCRS